MKFAKELEHDAVPEWRIKYLNYKAGKKYVKAVARAVNRTPRGFERRTPSFFNRPRQSTLDGRSAPSDGTHAARSASLRSQPRPSNTESTPIPTVKVKEDDALKDDGNTFQYGSFVPTPPPRSPQPRKEDSNEFELPAPALHLVPDPPQSSRPTHHRQRTLSSFAPRRSTSMAAVPTAGPSNVHPGGSISKQPNPGHSQSSPSQLRRMASHSLALTASNSARSEHGMQAFDLVKERETEFYNFMDSELDKVDSFYRQKEEQAGQRLTVLREQLHEMRNRRIQEMSEAARPDRHDTDESGHDSKLDHKLNGWMNPLKTKIFAPGPNSMAFQTMPRTPRFSGRQHGDAGRDYIRRPEDHDVSYRTAKRKLKLALQEFYRGLELLKSYAMLNRTAFRKLNKKLDKAINARPPYRYMNEKVNKAWFVNSEVLDGHIKTVEDLYARYFERGNHKLAAGKLRGLGKKKSDQTGSSFQNGFLIGVGLVFSIQGLNYGAQLLFQDDDVLRVHTSFLLQIYGGYFLMLLLFSLFCIDCAIWTRSKVNYPFIFEFDPRHHLDWRRLAVFPSFFLFLFGLFIWMNFSRYGPDYMYLYYPVILVFVTVLILFLPLPILEHKSRRWFLYAHWRLLLAGLYPVEFRDFFLGDIYCSLTYATANLELFFCLYAKHWENPPQCNSNHSRLLGFFTALPPIWRFLQCLRRYKDTRNVFPHLVNGGKYTMSILAAVMLSLYRIQNTRSHLALFISFSTINGVYCSIWDLFMDFSLLQTHSRHNFLRDILALKRRWPYYTIMVLDPLLRFAWIFYAIFTHNAQHSTIVSFLISLLEVIRRGMWTLFRVENEHCANVSQYKASRDVPLPYRIEPLMDRASAESSPVIQTQEQQAGQEMMHTGASSTAVASTTGTLTQRRETVSSRGFSRILAEAHKQDFEKRRKPGINNEHDVAAQDDQSDDDDDDDDEEETHSLLEVQEAAEYRRRGDDEV